MDYQGGGSGILETEAALYDGILLTELAKVVTQGVELYLGIVLGLGSAGYLNLAGCYFLFLNLCPCH